MITVDDYLIRESLFSFPHHMMPELKLSGELYRETEATLNIELRSDLHLNHAYSALAGIQGNYYHWLFFVLARLQLVFLTSWSDASPRHPDMHRC